MSDTYDEILAIDLEKIGSDSNVDPAKWGRLINKVDEILPLFKDTIRIINIPNSNLPSIVVEKFRSFSEEFHVSFQRIIDPVKAGEDMVNYVSKKINYVNHLISWIEQIQQKDFYTTISSIRLYIQNEEEDFESEFKRLMEEALPNTDTIIKNIRANQQTVNTLTASVQNKAKKHITSDYATIFEEVWKKHETYSRSWLAAGIASAIVFILLLSLGAFNSLPTENLIADKFQNYNIGNIIARVLILAIQIFFISFSFKQYSVNRHLQNVNRHRANAFESYQLFDNILPEKDDIHRNELMLQLAKAIYEQGSTGYLSEKGSNFNLSLTEITKMIGKTQ